jgi:hydrogenase nickel incorporation protein HypA/HybF
MHEFSITGSMIEILERIIAEKKLKKVESVCLEINPLASIEPESVKFYFDFLTKENKLLKGARLVFNKKSLAVVCKKCGNEFESDDIFSGCPECGEISGCKTDNLDDDDIRIVSLVAV